MPSHATGTGSPILLEPWVSSPMHGKALADPPVWLLAVAGLACRPAPESFDAPLSFPAKQLRLDAKPQALEFDDHEGRPYSRASAIP